METTLRQIISHYLQEQWLTVDPGPECFDAGEDQMVRLLEFIEGVGSRDDSMRVQDHLRVCSRCRFIYSKLSK